MRSKSINPHALVDESEDDFASLEVGRSIDRRQRTEDKREYIHFVMPDTHPRDTHTHPKYNISSNTTFCIKMF